MLKKPVKKVKIKKKTLFGYIIGKYDAKTHTCLYYTYYSGLTYIWHGNIREAKIYTSPSEFNEIVNKYKNKHKKQYFIIKCEYIMKKEAYSTRISPILVRQTKIHPFQHIQLMVNKL
jgi:hypothetical protein